MLFDRSFKIVKKQAGAYLATNESQNFGGDTLTNGTTSNLAIFKEILRYWSIVGQICSWMRGLSGYCNNKFNQGVLIQESKLR